MKPTAALSRILPLAYGLLIATAQAQVPKLPPTITVPDEKAAAAKKAAEAAAKAQKTAEAAQKAQANTTKSPPPTLNVPADKAVTAKKAAEAADKAQKTAETAQKTTSVPKVVAVPKQAPAVTKVPVAVQGGQTGNAASKLNSIDMAAKGAKGDNRPNAPSGPKPELPKAADPKAPTEQEQKMQSTVDAAKALFGGGGKPNLTGMVPGKQDSEQSSVSDQLIKGNKDGKAPFDPGFGKQPTLDPAQADLAKGGNPMKTLTGGGSSDAVNQLLSGGGRSGGNGGNPNEKGPTSGAAGSGMVSEEVATSDYETRKQKAFNELNQRKAEMDPAILDQMRRQVGTAPPEAAPKVTLEDFLDSVASLFSRSPSDIAKSRNLDERDRAAQNAYDRKYELSKVQAQERKVLEDLFDLETGHMTIIYAPKGSSTRTPDPENQGHKGNATGDAPIRDQLRQAGSGKKTSQGGSADSTPVDREGMAVVGQGKGPAGSQEKFLVGNPGQRGGMRESGGASSNIFTSSRGVGVTDGNPNDSNPTTGANARTDDPGSFFNRGSGAASGGPALGQNSGSSNSQSNGERKEPTKAEKAAFLRSLIARLDPNDAPSGNKSGDDKETATAKENLRRALRERLARLEGDDAPPSDSPNKKAKP